MVVFPHQLYPSDLVSAILLCALPLSIFASRLYHSKIKDYLKQVHYPPSPPSLPLFGHALSLPLSHSHIAMAEWYKTYGEIILISLLGSPIVILSTLSAARELMEKKGANFSGRPRMTFLREWIGWKNALAFIPYGEQQRKQRRLIHPHMTPSAITAHHSTLCSETQRFIIQLKENPDAFTEHIHDLLSRAVVMLTYGYEFTSQNDPKRLMIEEVSKVSTEPDMAFSMLVDLSAILRNIPSWFPGMGIKKRAYETSVLREKMSQAFFDFVVQSKALGTAKPSLVSQIIDNLNESKTDPAEVEQLGKDIGSFMYIAGVETTEITITTFFLAMAMYPQYARKAQEEIDNVTGGPGHRLPTFEDRPDLPYLECIIKEVLRWNPPIPLGIPHNSEKEDKYQDFTIPTDCSVLANIWFMCHDDDVYQQPMEFNPDRHLHFMKNTPDDNKSSASARPDDPTNVVFGFGRRICSGLHYADAALWVTFASVLSSFDILPPLDPITGEVVKLEARFTPTSTSHVAPFKCRIVPRS